MKKIHSGSMHRKSWTSEHHFNHNLQRATLIFCLTMICFVASLLWSKEVLAMDPIRSESQGIVEKPESQVLNQQFNAYTSGGNRLAKYTSYLASKQQRSIWNGETWKDKAPKEFAACAKTYKKIFADGIMKMNIAFGYSDNFDRTLDAGLYELTVDTLTSSCSGQRTACGFQLVQGTSRKAVLEKQIRKPAAVESSSQNLKIRMTISYSAANSRDEDNFSGGKITAAQKSATRVSEQVFFGGIQGIVKNGVRERCDVCVYYGHARDGGGPDFGPIPYEWRDNEGKTDYSQFHKRRTNYRLLLDAMEKAQDDAPALVAVLACYSHSHFYNKKACIDRSAPNCAAKSLASYALNSGFILTTEYSWFENFEKTFGTMLDGVLGLKCASAINGNYAGLRGQLDFKESYKIYGNFLQ